MKTPLFFGIFLISRFSQLLALKPENIIVVANSNESDSKALAHFYCQKRGVPTKNIVLLPTSTKEIISWDEFTSTILKPLREAVIKQGLVKLIKRESSDKEGIRSSQIFNDSMQAICVCKGIPLSIQNDPGKASTLEINYKKRIPEKIQKNESAVDSELAIFLIQDTPKIGFVPNPFFKNESKIDKAEEIKYLAVTRIEAPTYQSSRRMITDSIATERNGLIGRAYIDNGGPHSQGNEWLQQINDQLNDIDFDCSTENSPRLFQQNDRFDAPILYFGWYAGNYSGVFRNPRFRFPPGAIAFHIHSFSASTIRDPKKRWVGPLLEMGATISLGNVFEPYLNLSHHPHLLVKKLIEGYSFAEAHLYSVPVFSWQSVALGDPLYRPFYKSFDQQWEDRDPLEANSYLVLRKIQKALNENNHNLAIDLANSNFLKNPSIVLGLKRAQIYYKLNNHSAALNAIQFSRNLSVYSTLEMGLGNEIAQLADNLGDFSLALSIYKNLFQQEALTTEMAKAWLPKGIFLASRLNHFDLCENWRRRLALLKK